jgi:hypothetical protein
MKPLSLALWATAAVILTGCGKANEASRRTALDCPPTQGELKRTSVSADGRVCGYTDARGDEISLRLIPVASTPQAALAPIERELQALAPAPAPILAAADDDDDDDGDGGDRANISLHGVNIQADGDRADVKVGSLHVDASGGGAVIREAHETRLQGEQLSPKRRGWRAAYIVARNDLPDGLTSVGYEAGGPKAGPLTVAVLKIKDRDRKVIHGDVRRLLRRNAGI